MKNSLLAVVLVVFVAIFAGEIVNAEEPRIIEGTLNGLQWSINADTGVLEITGEGKINTSYYVIPWEEYRGLIKTVVISEGITEIGPYAFSGCYKLETVELPSTITTIGSFAFSRSSLSKISIPDNTTFIGDSAFLSTDIKEIIIPGKVQVIKAGVFQSCTDLKTVILSEGVESIELKAFSYTSLETIYLPQSLTTIDKSAFGDAGWDKAKIDTVIILSKEIASELPGQSNFIWSARNILLEKSIATSSTYVRVNFPYTRTVCAYGKTFTAYNKEQRVDEHQPHNQYTTSEDSHWKLCTICGIDVDKAQHEFDNVCDTFCNTCGYTRTITHSYKTTWEKDATQHWHVCSVCGVSGTKSGHTYDNACDTTCNTCGYTRIITHSYKTTWETDRGGHWHECSVCGASDEKKSHTPGAAATETTAQTCATCGFVIQAALSHTHRYKTEWTTNASQHWHSCSGCGDRKDEGNHVYDHEEDASCNVCGYTRIIVTAPDTSVEPEPSEPTPDETPDTVESLPTTDSETVTEPAVADPDSDETTTPETEGQATTTEKSDGDGKGTLIALLSAIGGAAVSAGVATLIVYKNKKKGRAA